MAYPRDWRLEPPEVDQVFEKLSMDIVVARRRPLTEPSLYGRSGQAQHGVDFVIHLRDGLHAFQCKCVQSFTFQEFKAEVAKLVAYPNALRSYTVLATIPKDARLQDEVDRMSLARVEAGQCPVAIVFWATIKDWFVEHLDILKKHLPGLVPRLAELHQGAARRIDEELPGTTLEYRVRPGRNEVVVHPGPAGVPFKAQFMGKDVVERFQAALKEGETATFAGEEFNFELPESLAFLMDVRDAESVSLSITPSLNDKRFNMGLVVHPIARHRSAEVFNRHAVSAPDAIPVVVTFVRDGTERQQILIEGVTVAIAWFIDTVNDAVAFRSERHSRTVGIHGVLAAAKLMALVDEGAYVGLVGDGPHRFWKTSPLVSGGPHPETLHILQLLCELSEATGWEFSTVDRFIYRDLEQVPSLLELFRTGRRVLADGPRRGRFTIESDAKLRELSAALKAGGQHIVMAFGHPRRQVEFLGVMRDFPPTRVLLGRLPISAEMRERVLTAGHPPVVVDFELPPDGEVVEMLVEEPADAALPAAQQPESGRGPDSGVGAGQHPS